MASDDRSRVAEIRAAAEQPGWWNMGRLDAELLIGELGRLEGELTESTAVRDALRRRHEEARAEIRRLERLLREHDSCQTCGHERRQHGRDPIIHRDWCRDCNTQDDLHGFEEETPS